MVNKARNYVNKDGYSIRFESARCIHAAECVKMPEVFNLENKPWANPDSADFDKIVAHISHCPSGALSAWDKDGNRLEVAQKGVTITMAENGPLLVNGEVEIISNDEKVIETRASLCRCGKSANKPYCDGSHAK
ncbi:MAG: CDGSH iron-sulfur domain-containing protein [Alphaproteobacteria bacterium]